jgi:hypothetical protein
MLLEAVRGKPMEERAQGEIVKWGFLSLIALMVVVLVNDVSAWVHGDLDFKKKDSKSNSAPKSVPKSESSPEIKTEAASTSSSTSSSTSTASPASEEAK